MSNADSGFSTFDETPVNKFNKKQLWSIAGDDRKHVLNISGSTSCLWAPEALPQPGR